MPVNVKNRLFPYFSPHESFVRTQSIKVYIRTNMFNRYKLMNYKFTHILLFFSQL